MRYASLLLIFALVLTGLGCKAEPTVETSTVDQTPANGDVTTVDEPFGAEQKIEKDTELYSVDAAFPSTGVEAIDASVRAFVEKQIEAFTDEPGVQRRSNSGTKSGLWITYETVQTPQVVTFVMYVSPYMADAAHPNTYIHTLTFEKTSGELITLFDVLQSGQAGLAALSDKALSALKAAGILDLTTEEWLADGTKPIEENLRRFALDEGRLIMYFDPYQLAAYAAGPQKVFLPAADLDGVIREQYL